MTHDKISFTREYLRCRHISYKFKGESLYIDGNFVCYSIYNIPYNEIIQMVDNEAIYDEYGFFESLAIPRF